MNNHSEIVSFIWSIADLIRDTFKRSKYQDVILPLTVLRRIDGVLAPTKPQVLTTYGKLKGRLDNLYPQLCRASGLAFYNTSPFTFESLLADAPHLAANLRAYIAGFSDNMREVLEKFDFHNTLSKLDDAGLLFLVMERFKTVDLHPDRISNHSMGTVFEELLRRFNEALNENPGEHFTPREVVRLMVLLVLALDDEILRQSHIVRTVSDPCCGAGGMLTVSKDCIAEINPQAEVYLFGQEVNPETFALCKADLYLKSADGRDAENIAFGSTLARDAHAGRRFDYQLANPPYGKEWKMDQADVEREAERGGAGRFGAGLPRISDGQLLFLQHMLSRMKPPQEGGGRVAIVMNGSPLFTGDSGSGESEIRRWILENDWLEAIVALPEQLFYNTGIATYIWILSNRKQEERRGKVQLIDATGLWAPMRKSLGDKRRELAEPHIQEVVAVYKAFADSGRSKVFPTTALGYRKITVERPLRLNFQAGPERIARLREHPAFRGLAVSKKKEPEAKAQEEALGHRYQEQIIAALNAMPDTLFKDRSAFEDALDAACRGEAFPGDLTTTHRPASDAKMLVATGSGRNASPLRLTPPIRKAILAALAERDETAEICRDKDGNPEPDPELRDAENVPLGEDVTAYFEREVKPHVPDAWINAAIRDSKDGGVGKVGYEINFNRYFYTYKPPRPLAEIEVDIRTLEAEILTLLREVAG